MRNFRADWHTGCATRAMARSTRSTYISTGNIANADLEGLFVAQLPTITSAFESYSYLELTRTTLIFHS